MHYLLPMKKQHSKFVKQSPHGSSIDFIPEEISKIAHSASSQKKSGLAVVADAVRSDQMRMLKLFADCCFSQKPFSSSV